jgi:hypothetical protein
MSSKKKRTKKYQGSNAATHTTVTKVSAVKRNPLHQWWVERKKFARPVAIGVAVVLVIIVVIVGIISALR